MMTMGTARPRIGIIAKARRPAVAKAPKAPVPRGVVGVRRPAGRKR